MRYQGSEVIGPIKQTKHVNKNVEYTYLYVTIHFKNCKKKIINSLMISYLEYYFIILTIIILSILNNIEREKRKMRMSDLRRTAGWQ